LGLFVERDKHAELWQMPSPISLAECAINDAGDQVACLEGSRVVRLRPL
jgi:hypothetical protein